MLSPQKTQLGDWLNELFLADQEVRLTFAPLSEAQWAFRPAAGKWSIGECINHLAITTALMLDQVKPVLEQARVAGKLGNEPYRFGRMGGWFVRSMEKPGKRPMPSPPNFVPPSDIPKPPILDRWAAVQKDFEETMKQSYGLALDRITARSGARGGWWLRLNIAAWFASTLAHMRRHLAQAERVRQASGYPA